MDSVDEAKSGIYELQEQLMRVSEAEGENMTFDEAQEAIEKAMVELGWMKDYYVIPEANTTKHWEETFS